jgi:hypothetical protein
MDNTGVRQMRNMTDKAQAYDNRVERMASVLDAARPFVAVKPVGFINPVIGHYATMKGAKEAARRFNKLMDDCAA